jgi:hypothetical protein
MALASFVVTFATLVGIVVIGIVVEGANAAGRPESERAMGWAVPLFRFAVLFGIPLIATSVVLLVRRRSAAIATRAIATVVLLLWSLLFVFSAIIGFLPAAAMMAIALILAISDTGSQHAVRVPDGG